LHAGGRCGIPSIWRSPTTRQPGGSPHRNRCVRGLAPPPGWRVVALQEVEGMPHPAYLTQSQQFWWLVIPEIRLVRSTNQDHHCWKLWEFSY
jgi:hypothetical protein